MLPTLQALLRGKWSVKAKSEKVSGVKEVPVSGSITRSGHTRTLDGKRNFYIGGYDIPGGKAEAIRSAEGSFVTKDEVPEELLSDIVNHGIAATVSPSEHEGHAIDEHSRSGY